MADYLLDNAPDMYCHQLARIDVLGPNRRLVFTMPATNPQDAARGEQVVVIKLIVPAELLADLAFKAAGADRDTVSPQLIAFEGGRAN
jgi:hypothetical protein